jgi:TolB-like protein/lipoprotein NlpI
LSIAVLPFENMSNDPGQEYFTAGMHDELLTRLSRIAALKVISRTSVMPYRNSDKSLPDIAKELSVATILEGGIQKLGDQVRINVQLINAHTDEHLWAEIYDRKLTAENLFAIQSDISRAIAQSLQATLTSDEDLALKRTPTQNLAAYDAYIAGRANLDGFSFADMNDAAEQFSNATQLDPQFAAAWAGLCEAQLSLYNIRSDRKNFDTAEAACTSALELDDSRAEVHIAMARLYSSRGQYAHAEVSLQRADFARAEEALKNVVSFDELTTRAQINLGFVLVHQGRLAEAETELLGTVETDPRNWEAQSALFSFYYTYSDKPNRFELAARHATLATALRPDQAALWNNLGTSNFMLGRYDQAADAWQHSLAIEPTRTAYTNTGLALYNTGRFEAAAKMQARAIEIAPDDHRPWGRLGDALRFVDGEGARAHEAYVKAMRLAREILEINDKSWRTLGMLSTYLAFAGESEEAMLVAERAMQLAKRNSETLFYAAIVKLSEGQSDACLSLLEEAVAKDPDYRNLIAVDPDLKQLSELPRFQALVTKP